MTVKPAQLMSGYCANVNSTARVKYPGKEEL